MGEKEKKEEEKKSSEVGGESEEKKKEEEKKEEEPPEIVLRVDMHCEACARKVIRALKRFEGVEKATADSKASRVVVKGKPADPLKLCERIQKKTGRKAVLISPLPKPPEDNKDHNTNENKPEPPKEEEKKGEPPAVVTVVLNVRMHCEACALALQKRILKIQGVESVATDLANDQVIVKGVVDPAKLVDDVYKKTRRQVSIVKEEEKKVEEEKKEEKPDEKKDGEDGEGPEDEKKSEIKKSEYMPPRYYMEYAYAYPSQMFSDENPNACSVM